MGHKIFTLAPEGHSTDPEELERAGYKVWSTFRQKGPTLIEVRTNNEQTAGGQVWRVIAREINGLWYVKRGRGYFGQGAALLSRYLADQGERVRSEAPPAGVPVLRYEAKGRRYSLPSLLNGGEVLNRDAEADKRSQERKGIGVAEMAARLEMLKAKRAFEAEQKAKKKK